MTTTALTTATATTTNPIALTDMNTNTNPIEIFIVALLALLEGICWVINELAGFHAAPALALPAAPEPLALPPALDPITDPREAAAIEAPGADAPDGLDITELAAMTVRELRRMCVDMGLPRATYHAARKQQLIAALA